LLLLLLRNDNNKTYNYEEAFHKREGQLVFCLFYNMQSLPQKREAFFGPGPHEKN